MDPILDPNTGGQDPYQPMNDLQAAAGDNPAMEDQSRTGAQPTAESPVEIEPDTQSAQPPTIQIEMPPTDEILPTSEIPQAEAINQPATIPEDKTAQFTKILKIAVPVIVALVVGVGGYFAYITFFGGNEVAQPQENDSTNTNNTFSNFLTPGDQMPTDQTNLENSLKDSLNQTGTSTDTGTQETPSGAEDTQPKQKVPRT